MSRPYYVRLYCPLLGPNNHPPHFHTLDARCDETTRAEVLPKRPSVTIALSLSLSLSLAVYPTFYRFDFRITRGGTERRLAKSVGGKNSPLQLTYHLIKPSVKWDLMAYQIGHCDLISTLGAWCMHIEMRASSDQQVKRKSNATVELGTFDMFKYFQ